MLNYCVSSRHYLAYHLFNANQTSAVFVALLVLDGLVASTATRVLARLQTYYATLNLLYAYILTNLASDSNESPQAVSRNYYRSPRSHSERVQELR